MKHGTVLHDIVFKIVFGAKKNRTILRALLNALLSLSGQDRIRQVTLLGGENDKAYLEERGVILDVRAQDGQGRFYNVELQVSNEPDYVPRILFYLAKLFAGQLESGEQYDKLAKTISISILDFTLFPDVKDLHSAYRFHDVQHQRELSDLLEIHFIELRKFRHKPPALRTPFERWLYFLKFSELYQSGLEALPAVLEKEDGIPMALKAIRKAYATDEVREYIEAVEKARRDEATRLAHAETKGQHEGSLKARRKIAAKLLASGMDKATVLAMTDLKPEELPKAR
jgi:predicted transposase/invertase (TIGR01784 family)